MKYIKCILIISFLIFLSTLFIFLTVLQFKKIQNSHKKVIEKTKIDTLKIEVKDTVYIKEIQYVKTKQKTDTIYIERKFTFPQQTLIFPFQLKTFEYQKIKEKNFMIGFNTMFSTRKEIIPFLFISYKKYSFFYGYNFKHHFLGIGFTLKF